MINAIGVLVGVLFLYIAARFAWIILQDIHADYSWKPGDKHDKELRDYEISKMREHVEKTTGRKIA